MKPTALATALGALAFAATPALAAPPEAPVTLSPAKSITATTAILEGTLNPGAKAKAGWYFDYSTELTCALNALTTPLYPEEEVKAKQVARKVRGLEPSRTYTFCLVATNEAGETTPSLNLGVSLTTLAAPPTVENEAASSVKASEATLEALINPNNQSTGYTIEYASSEAALGTAGATKSTGGPLTGYGNQTVSFATGAVLAPGTTYFYRVLAKNVSSEETKGKVQSFTTYTHPETPETTSPAKSVTGTTAVLEGTLNPHGTATTKAGWYFAYNEGSSCAGGPSTPFQREVEGKALPQKAEVTGLQPNRKYTFCLVAANGGGESAQGNEVSLPTLVLAPTIESESATAVKATEATLGAAINPNNQSTTYEFEYAEKEKAGVLEAPIVKVPVAPPAALENFGGQTVSVPTEVLTPHTTYYYRVLAENAAHEKSEGKVEHFITGPLETPDKLEAKPIAATTATLNGVLDPNHTINPGTYEFLYRQSATECEGGETSSGSALGSMQEAVKAEVTGLEPNTRYTFCLRARNEAAEETLSAPVTFRTLPEAYATSLASSSATLHGVLDPEGSTISYHFEYGTSTTYGSQTPEATTSLASVEVHLQGLATATLYHYRLLATNAAHETFESEDETFTTPASATAFTLPDGRQYEMVTPPEKEGAQFYSTGKLGDVIQASINGSAIGDMASLPIEAEPQGHGNEDSSVLSTRGSEGWVSQVINGSHSDGATTYPGTEGEEIRLFSEDLSHVVVQPQGLFTPLSPEASEPTAYLRTDYFNGNVTEHCEASYPHTSSSCYQPLVTRANTRTGAVFGELKVSDGECTQIICGPHFVDASPDLSHIILSSEAQLTTSLPQGWAGDYEWSNGQLQPLPGRLAGMETIGARHAISADGGRVILNGNGGLDLFEVAKGETVRLDAAEPGCGKCGNGGGEFQNANGDDSRIFFLDAERLTVDSGAVRDESEESEDQHDLYECEIVEVAGKAQCNLSDLTPPMVAGGEPADVHAVLGVSDDGSYVYFAAGGALAPGSVPNGCHRTSSEFNTEGCNVYVRHDGVTRLVAAGWIQDGGIPRFERSRVSPDGRWLAFMSSKGLTGNDTRDAISGQPDDEVYLYHAETSPSGALEPGKLICVSCDPAGERPVGVALEEGEGPVAAASVPRWLEFASGEKGATGTRYQSRYLSDSGRLFFDSEDALVSQDVNGAQDVYEYEPASTRTGEDVPAGEHACSPSSTSGSEVFKPAHAFEVGGVKGEEGAGCVALISSGTSSEPSSFVDASETGGDVFFLTASKLAPQDFDSAPDVYDARECTSASPCPASVVAPPPCTTEASCKPPPTPQPSIYGLPASATFSGPSNLTPTPPPPPKKVTKKTVKCKKGFVKNKKGKCVKKPKKRSKKAKKSSNHRRAK